MYCIFSSCELLIAFSTLPNLSLPRCLIVIAAILAFVLLVTVTVTLVRSAADHSANEARRANSGFYSEISRYAKAVPQPYQKNFYEELIKY